MLTIDLKNLSYFKHVVQSLLNTYVFGIRFWSHTNHISLKRRCPIKIITESGTLTLLFGSGFLQGELLCI